MALKTETRRRYVSELVDTRINGNSIKGCKTYESMLRQVTKNDIFYFVENEFGLSKFGTKLEMIEEIRDYYNEINRLEW